MTNSAARIRSWLFAPGDSARKMEKALASNADQVIFDLEDSVALSAKSEARRMVVEVLEAAGERQRIWVRINPLPGGLAEEDLAAVMTARPAGIMLPKSESGADVAALNALLSPLEPVSTCSSSTRRVCTRSARLSSVLNSRYSLRESSTVLPDEVTRSVGSCSESPRTSTVSPSYP